MRFLLRASISFALALPALAQLPYAIFRDVPSNKPYYDQVNLLRERVITQGCQVYPAEYCPEPPYTLTRGQAAVLIIRSIYSARTGDPEGFPAPPTTPYLTDVSSDHPQFTYIQKMKELGITQGVTETTFEPWGTLNFAQTAVFTYRARQIRRWEPLTPPAACGGPAFADVPANYLHCAYIREMAGELGYDKAISPNCWTGFCPESIAMNRGILAFYLVNGVMNVGQPQWLPNGGGAVPGVWLPGPPEPDCSHGGPQGDFAFGNQIVVLGGFLYSWANTYVNNPGNPDVWNQYTAMRLYASGSQLYFDEDHSAYGANWSGTMSYNYIINPNLNYRNDAWHSVASMCLANGNSWFTSVNNPMIVGLTTPSVLYRGISQNIIVRGSTLQNFVGVHLESTSALMPISNPAASPYQVTVTVTPPFDTSPGSRQLYLSAISPNDGVNYATNSLPITVADLTPVITSITPSVGTQGSTFPATLSGNYFGSNPTVCILVSAGNCVQSFGGVTVTRGVCGAWPSCNTQIPITIAIDSNAAVISYQIAVLSNGANGSGFQSGGGSQPTTPAPALFQVQACTSSLSVVANPFALVTGALYRARFTALGIPSGGTYTWTSSDPIISNVSQVTGQPQNADINSGGHGKFTITVQYTSACGATSSASRTFIRTRDVSVLGFVDKDKIDADWATNSFNSQVSQSLQSLLEDGIGCGVALAAWLAVGETGSTLPLTPLPAAVVETPPNRAYANYYLLSNSANSGSDSPPQMYSSPAQAASQTNQFRLFQRFLALWEVNSQNIRIGAPQYLAADTAVGMTLEPCSGVTLGSISPTGDFHTGFNGRVGVDANGNVYQVNEVRVGRSGRAVNRYLNHFQYPDVDSTTPYAYSAIQFDSNGNGRAWAQNPGTIAANLSRFPSFRSYFTEPTGTDPGQVTTWMQSSIASMDFMGFVLLDATYYYAVP